MYFEEAKLILMRLSLNLTYLRTMTTASTLLTLKAALDIHFADNLTEADRLYRQVLGVDSENAETLHGLGAIACQRKDFDIAIYYANKLLQNNNERWLFLNTLAATYRGKGEFEEAMQIYFQALKQQPGNVILKNNFATVWQEIFDRDRVAAIEMLQKLAVYYYKSGKMYQCECLLRRVLSLDSNNSKSIHYLGMVAKKCGKKLHALSLIRKAILITSDAAYFYSDLGIIYQDRNQIKEALRCYLRAMQINPEFMPAQYNFSYTMSILRDSDLDCWKSEILLSARKLYQSNCFKVSLNLYNKLLEVEPTHAEALREREDVNYQKTLLISENSKHTSRSGSSLFTRKGCRNGCFALTFTRSKRCECFLCPSPVCRRVEATISRACPSSFGRC